MLDLWQSWIPIIKPAWQVAYGPITSQYLLQSTNQVAVSSTSDCEVKIKFLLGSLKTELAASEEHCQEEIILLDGVEMRRLGDPCLDSCQILLQSDWILSQIIVGSLLQIIF